MKTFTIKSVVTAADTKPVIKPEYTKIMESWSNGCSKVYGKFKLYFSQTEYIEYDMEDGKQVTESELREELEYFSLNFDNVEPLISSINLGKYLPAPHHEPADKSDEAKLARIVLGELDNPSAKEFSTEAILQGKIAGFSDDVIRRCIQFYA